MRRLVLQVAHATLRKLTDIKGISEQKAQKLKDIAYKLVPMGFLTVSPCAARLGFFSFGYRLPAARSQVSGFCLVVQAAQQLQQRQDLITLSTGSKDLDQLLGGEADEPARKGSQVDAVTNG
jgi:hypothetical protein